MRRTSWERGLVFIAIATLLVGCSNKRATGGPAGNHKTEGKASWYGPGFAGRPTASGEIYDPRDMTAAHKTLPFGTRVLVNNLDNGRSVWVRINDRGPFVRGRIIDLSNAAARAIEMVGPGIARVSLEFGRPAESAPSSPGSHWALQIGAYTVAANAQAKVDELAPLGINAHIEVGDGLHRVRIGPFSVRSDADTEMEHLREHEIPAIMVTVVP